MAQVIADSSSLIHLQKIEQLSLLEGLFGEVAIPRAVADEVKRTLPALPSWIHAHTLSGPIPPAIARRLLGAGESEAMALALERQIPRVILDDLEARQLARSLGLEVVGTGAVLCKAKARGLNPRCAPDAGEAARDRLPLEPEGLPLGPAGGWRGGLTQAAAAATSATPFPVSTAGRKAASNLKSHRVTASRTGSLSSGRR